MWKDRLGVIVDEKKMYDEEINKGATKEEIEKFIKGVKESLGKEMPEEYLNTLKQVNGIEFNGFILYGIDELLLENVPNQHVYGLIESNQIWYENEEQKQYLFLGESNISWYVYKYKDGSFIELDNPSGRESARFSNFQEMLEKLLSDSLL